VHTGLPYREHRVFDLGDGHKLTAPRLWDHVSDAGGRVWICGSINAGASGRPLNGSARSIVSGIWPASGRKIRRVLQSGTYIRPGIHALRSVTRFTRIVVIRSALKKHVAPCFAQRRPCADDTFSQAIRSAMRGSVDEPCGRRSGLTSLFLYATACGPADLHILALLRKTTGLYLEHLSELSYTSSLMLGMALQGHTKCRAVVRCPIGLRVGKVLHRFKMAKQRTQ
jgi:hypothetical protein